MYIYKGCRPFEKMFDFSNLRFDMTSPPFQSFLNVLFVFVFWRFVIVGKGVYKIFSITEMEKMRHCKKGWKSIFHYTASCDVSFQMEDVPIIYLNHFESLYIWIIWRLLISQGRDRAQRHILSQINRKKKDFAPPSI